MAQYQFGETERFSLFCEYGGKQIKWVYPPIRRNSDYFFEMISEDSELVPTDDLGLALLVKGAFSSSSLKWEKVKSIMKRDGNLGIPKKLLWMPSTHEFVGVFVGNFLRGKSYFPGIAVPESLEGWKKENEIYFNLDGNVIFVPRNSYELGDQRDFSKNGFVVALLGSLESAKVVQEVTREKSLVPFARGIDITKIEKPISGVAGIDVGFSRLRIGEIRKEYDSSYFFGMI